MNEYEKNVYKCIFEYPTKKIVELELENENQRKQLETYKNVIKEAIKLIEDNWITYEDSKQFIDFNESLPVFIKEINDLLKILNKVGGEK